MSEQQWPIDDTLSSMATDLDAWLAKQGREDAALIGIHTGGVWIDRKSVV